MDYALEVRGITKVFPGVVANKGVSLAIQKGEIHAIIGENGAGKSTLMKVVYGLHQPTEGEIYVWGEKTKIPNPRVAINKGIGMVHQHFMLVPSFTVAQNIVLGMEPRKGARVDFQKAREITVELSEQYGLKVEPDVKVIDLSVGIQQRIEILKALYRGAEILILDEPTAVLTPQETEDLFKTIRKLVDGGKTVIFISHKLQEVLNISQRVSVMRAGELVGTVNTKETNGEELARMMVGREVLFNVEKKKAEPGEAVLKVENLEVLDNRGLTAVRGISFEVRRGEILGIAGVEGNGQSELIEAITGLRKEAGGKVFLGETDISGYDPDGRRKAGIAHVPEDRLKMGLNGKGTITENMMMGIQHQEPYATKKLHLNFRTIRKFVDKLIKDFDVRTPSQDVLVTSLSGGNMQKVVIAREFSFPAKVLVVSQPTRGIDVGAIEFIHKRIIQKRDEGYAILLVSAELDEIFQLSDRILVMYEGKITGEFTPDVTREEIGLYMAGAKSNLASAGVERNEGSA